MKKLSEQAFSLIELMIVVAIIGILAGIAVYMYTKTHRKAKASEVRVMFAEFKAKQELHYVENDTYLATGTEATPHPAAPAGADTPTPVAPLPASWETLKVTPNATNLYCTYVAVTGPAGDASNAGGKANGAPFNFSTYVPTADWYYLLAECDFDNKPVNSFYFARSDQDGVLVENPGM